MLSLVFMVIMVVYIHAFHVERYKTLKPCKHLIPNSRWVPFNKMRKCIANNASDQAATVKALADFENEYTRITIDGTTPLFPLYTRVLASDGYIYAVLDPIDKDFLTILIDCQRRVLLLAREMVRQYPSLPATRRLTEMVKTCGMVCNIIQKHDKDNPNAGGHTFSTAYMPWICMSKGWSLEHGGNTNMTFGSIVHEIGHIVCGTDKSCENHGAGWCRTQAVLLSVAKKIGIWEPADVVWASRLQDMQRATYVTPPSQDGLMVCDKGMLFR